MKEEEKETTIDHVLKYTGIFGGVQVLNICASIFRGKFSALFLGTYGVGLLAIYQNILEWIKSFTNLGMETCGVQRIGEVYEDHPKVLRMAEVIRTWSLAIALLDFVACLLVAPIFDYYLFGADDSHLTEILLLFPAAFFAPIAVGECTLLKGTRQLKRVAAVELLTTLASVLVTIPMYCMLGIRGIILSLDFCVMAEALIHLYYSVTLIGYKVNLFDRENWRQGVPMLRMGVPYVVASMFAAFSVTMIFNIIGDTSSVGLYRVGSMLMLTYIGVIFNGIAPDYFPRLTTVVHDRAKMNNTINQQIFVCLMLALPLIMVFVLSMPLMVRILYTEEFLPVVNMCVVASLYPLLRAVSNPLGYVPLAHGRSVLFFFMELAYNVVLVVATYFMYQLMGFIGTGVAMSVVGIFDVLLLGIVYRYQYGVILNKKVQKQIVASIFYMLLLSTLCLQENVLLKYGAGSLLCLICMWQTLLSLSRESSNKHIIALRERIHKVLRI